MQVKSCYNQCLGQCVAGGGCSSASLCQAFPGMSGLGLANIFDIVCFLLLMGFDIFLGKYRHEFQGKQKFPISFTGKLKWTSLLPVPGWQTLLNLGSCVSEIKLFKTHCDIYEMVEYIKSKACVQFLLGGKRAIEHVHVQNYNQWANNSSQRLPFFYYIPCAGHCLPYTLLFIGKQSDCLSSTLNFAIYQLYNLEQIYSPSCSSTFLICKMGMRLAPI